MFKWLNFSKTERIDNGPDPEDISVENAYKTRWIWYHTILALELLMTNVLLAAILTALVLK